MFVSGMSKRYSAKPGANAQDLFIGKNFVIAAVLEENCFERVSVKNCKNGK